MPDDPPWLDADQLEAWIAVSVFLELFPAAVDAQLRRDVGVNRFEYTLMAMLSEQPEHTLAMSELAEIAFGSLSRLSHAVSRLEKRGWVRRRPGAGGRRHTTVSLTADGLAAITAAAPRHAAEVRRLLIDVLDADELASLSAIARKLVEVADPATGERLDDLIPEVVARNIDAAGP